MNNTTLHRIRQTLGRLRQEKEQVSAQYQAEKENLHVFERELDELRAQSDYLNGVIQEKEEAVSEFNKMIEESEKAYTRLVDKSAELLQALDNEANSLRMRLRPGTKEKGKKETEEEGGEEGEEEDNEDNDDDED